MKTFLENLQRVPVHNYVTGMRKVEESKKSATDNRQNSFYKWTQMWSLEINIFDIKKMKRYASIC